MTTGPMAGLQATAFSFHPTYTIIKAEIRSNFIVTKIHLW